VADRQHARDALRLLDEIADWHQRLVLNLASGEGLGAAHLVDLLEVIEHARAALPGGNLPWQTETDYAYRAGLIIAEARIRAVFLQWPAEPSTELGQQLVDDINNLLMLRPDIEVEL
jgi:hypothetical protein